jgi:hypothetical protein
MNDPAPYSDDQKAIEKKNKIDTSKNITLEMAKNGTGKCVQIYTGNSLKQKKHLIFLSSTIFKHQVFCSLWLFKSLKC